MFVPVACLRCSKLFQVAPAAAGTDVTCPWCREPTPALPVATDTPAVPSPPAPPPAPAPLSLDDAEQVARPTAAPSPPRLRAKPVAPATSRPPVSLKQISLVAVSCVVVAGVTIAVLGFRTGRGGASGWVEFTAPDGSFTATFPTDPSSSSVPANPHSAVTQGGEEYAAAGWYSGVRAWVAWQDLDPAWVKRLAEDKDGTIGTLEAELARRLKESGGTVTKQGPLQTTSGRGLQVAMETPRGVRVERYILAAGAARPRLYVVGVEGPKLDPDGPLPTRVLTAFRIN